MSLQVGNACFATPVDAGIAACAAFSPVSSISSDGSKFRSISCASADANTGALNLSVVTTDLASATSTTSQISQQLAYPDCIQSQYYDAGLTVFGAVLAAVFTCYGLWAVRRMITSNTRIAE